MLRYINLWAASMCSCLARYKLLYMHLLTKSSQVVSEKTDLSCNILLEVIS